jgi:hypothetical protein
MPQTTTTLRSGALFTIATFLLAFGFTGPLKGQTWATCGSAICTSGDVGIGTSSPTAPLHVAAPVGAGATVTLLQLQQAGYGDNARVRIGAGGYTGGIATQTAIDFIQNSASNWQSQIAFSVDNGNTLNEAMRINPSGYVGIGTQSPSYPLSVNGTIQAKEVLVNTGWSDYVFDSDYRLAPLTEVAEYVQEHHHLPEIPSAAEVAEKGISVGEIQSKLLAKIEELTLHMIQAEQENRSLKERLARLEQISGSAKR